MRKKYKYFRPRIKSRHKSHNSLRGDCFELFPFRSVIRLGSTTNMIDTVTNGGNRIEINTINGINNCSDKIRMKQIFTEYRIKSPEWMMLDDVHSVDIIEECDLRYPLVAKRHFHSRGRGMVLLSDESALERFKMAHRGMYYIETFYNYHKEFRIHCSTNGIFCALRKLRKAESEDRWFFNGSNCVFKRDFEKPYCWNEIESECIKAVKALKMNICGFDVRVRRDGSDFTIIEANSACSFGFDNSQFTKGKYVNEITNLLKEKYDNFINN